MEKTTNAQGSMRGPSALNNLHWEELKPNNSAWAPSNRNCHSVILFEKYMIVFGGKEGDGKRRYVNDLHVLDLDNLSWCSPAKVTGTPPEARMGHTACLFDDNKMIVFGGWNGGKVLDDTWILTINEKDGFKIEWEQAKVEKTPPKRQFHTANIYQHNMYVFGGGDGKYWLNELYALNLSISASIKNNFTWQLIDTLGERPLGRLQHSSVVGQGKLYVFGGEPDRQRQLNDLHILDLHSYNWQKVSPLGISPAARVSASAQRKGNKIFFFGGFDGQSWRNDMFAYNTEDNTWETIMTYGNLPKPRCRHTSIIHNNTLIIFGGNDSEMSFCDLYGLNLDIKLQVSSSTLVTDLKNMLNEQLYCDVIFQVEDQEIPAHRAILASRCDHFKNMFSSQLMESQANKVVISDVKPEIFKALLEYIYSDNINLTDNLSLELLVASDKYLLSRLKSLCEQYISQRLSTKNIIDTINIADKYEATYLKDCAFNFLLSNKDIICESQDISKLSKTILVELVKSRLFK